MKRIFPLLVFVLGCGDPATQDVLSKSSSKVIVTFKEPSVNEIVLRTVFTCPTSLDSPEESGLDPDTRLTSKNLVIVWKEKRLLGLYKDGVIQKRADSQEPACYRIALGVYSSGIPAAGRKLYRGDRRTPEGWYRISDKPRSTFPGAIAIHYPNESDAWLGRRNGLISNQEYQEIAEAAQKGCMPPENTALGNNILIHGFGSARDWTNGCIALDDEDLDDVRELMPRPIRGWLLIRQ